MTQKGTQVYVFDALNRMTQVTGKETYLYDGHGRRVQVTKTSDSKKNYPIYGLDGKLLLEDNRQTLTRTEYIYAGGRLIAKRIQPIDSAGVNNGTATVTTIHTDFLGSPVAETNSAGTVSRVERYTPYGEPSDMALDAGPGFTGHATDVATGLTYMQQRYYDPDIGRFISSDPVGPEEDFVNHFNRYNYALNNPVKYTDPDGQEYGYGMNQPEKITGCKEDGTCIDPDQWDRDTDARAFMTVIMVGPTFAVGGYYGRAAVLGAAYYAKNNPGKVKEGINTACTVLGIACGFGKDGVVKKDHDLPDQRAQDEIAQAATKSIPAKPTAGGFGKPNSSSGRIGKSVKISTNPKTGVKTVTVTTTGTRMKEVYKYVEKPK